MSDDGRPPEDAGPPNPPDGSSTADGPADEDVAGDVPDNVIVLPRLEPSTPSEAAAPSASSEGQQLGCPPSHLLEGAVEALLFAADTPMRLTKLNEWLQEPGEDAIHDALLSIRERLRRDVGGIRLVEVAKGWQLRTDPRFGPWVAAMRGGRPVRLSRAALDTLSIIAYRQPCVRSEIEQLRGVDCGGVLRMLVERGLVQVAGRTSDPGRPLLYATTAAFLELFGLRDLSDLPTLRDLRELQRDDSRLGPGLFPAEDELDDISMEEASSPEPSVSATPPTLRLELPPDPALDDGDEDTTSPE